MKELHYVYLKYVMGELEHDAIMAQAERCGVDSVKKFLSMIVSHEINRFRSEYIETLTGEELRAYEDAGGTSDYLTQAGGTDPDLDIEIPF